MKKFFKKGKALKIMCFALIIIIGLGIYNIVNGKYPTEWANYINSSGLNDTIYNYSKTEMDKYSGSYTIVPTDGDITDFNAHGNNNEYTNLTVDQVKKKKSRWFISGYGPFLHYAQSNSPESNSIKFSEEDGLFNNSNHVYITHNSADLGDSKSLAMYYYDKDKLPPLLINESNSSLSPYVISTVKKHNKKNIVVLGGSQRYTTMFGIGEQFNVVRVGGADRNQTYAYLSFAEESSDTIYNVSSPPKLNSDGYICEIKTDKIEDFDKEKIEAYLKKFNFEAAAKLALENYQYGSPVNASYGTHEVLIGCKESASSDKMKFLKVYFLRESSGFQYGVYQYVGTEYKYDNSPNPNPNPEPTPGTLPTAKIYAPNEVVVGNDVSVSGSGRSTDENVTSLEGIIYVSGREVYGVPIYSQKEIFEEGRTNKNISWGRNIWFGEEGIYPAHSIVIDSAVQTGESEVVNIKAVAPIPYVQIDKSEVLKENRKIVIDASKSHSGSQRYSIDWEKAKWEVTATGGNLEDIRIQTHTEGSTNGEILFDSSRSISKPLNGLKSFDMTFKKPGTYKIKCTLTNNYKEGKTNSNEITIVVEPDIPPVANFTMPTGLIRNIDNNAPNSPAKATQTLTDTESGDSGSYSTDGDLIGDRAWLLAFDADNNRTYNNDKWYLYNGSTNEWEYLGDINSAENYNFSKSNGNKKVVDFSSTHVGKYRVELLVREQFGEEYIPQFVSENDRRIGSSFNQ